MPISSVEDFNSIAYAYKELIFMVEDADEGERILRGILDLEYDMFVAAGATLTGPIFEEIKAKEDYINRFMAAYRDHVKSCVYHTRKGVSTFEGPRKEETSEDGINEVSGVH